MLNKIFLTIVLFFSLVNFSYANCPNCVNNQYMQRTPRTIYNYYPQYKTSTVENFWRQRQQRQVRPIYQNLPYGLIFRTIREF